MTAQCRILGTGAVGAFGCGKTGLFEALKHEAVTPTPLAVGTADGVVGINLCQADLSGAKGQFPTKLIRRYNRFTKMVAFAAQQALVNAGIEETVDRSRLGIILATGYGSSVTTFEFLDSYHEDNNSYVSPMTFSNSVLSAAASATTILLNITGPALTVHQLESSVPLALDTARLWLETGRVDHVLVGGGDEYCDVLGYTYACEFGPSTDRIDIQNSSKQTAFPGEGAAFFLLGRASNCQSNGEAPSLLLDCDPAGSQQADATIIGFDGHSACRLPYAPYYQDTTKPTLCLANLFGSFPTAMMLDIATAVAMIESKPDWNPSLSIHSQAPAPGRIGAVDIVKAQDATAVRTIRIKREDG